MLEWRLIEKHERSTFIDCECWHAYDDGVDWYVYDDDVDVELFRGDEIVGSFATVSDAQLVCGLICARRPLTEGVRAEVEAMLRDQTKET